MTLLSRMQCWSAPLLRLLLWVFRHFLRVHPLRELSFIHFAHWSVLDGLAIDQVGGTGARKEKYLLFESNFNGTWHEYIEAFCQVVGTGIHAILAGCEGFPGLVPARGFKPFIEHHEFVTDHYYSAYPNATATMIRAALELDDRVRALRIIAARANDAKFSRAWRLLLTDPRVQANLAGRACTHPGVLAYLRQLAFARKNVAGNACAFIALIPIEPDQADALRTHLRGLPSHDASPLAKVPGTHFGRWAVIDRVFHDSWPEEYEVLDPAYLLFTAVFDVTSRDAAGAYLDRLVSVLDTEADAIWGKCQGWPAGNGRQERVDYLRRHQRDTNFLFSAYQGRVEEIRSALVNRELLMSFACQAQTLDSHQLRVAFAAAITHPVHRGEGR
ncbi:MAG: hypothetical protein ACRDTC_04805 [Pseudonocardiaceae bacterium]